MDINLSFKNVSLAPLADWLAQRSARITGGFLLGLTASTGGAIALPGYQGPLIVAAALSLAGLLGMGLRARNWWRMEANEVELADVLDAFFKRRGDADYYRALLSLLADSFRRFEAGDIRQGEESWRIRNSALDGLLELECRLFQHLGIENVSMLIARVTGDHYVIRRAAGPLKLKVQRDHRCRIEQDLDASLRRLAPAAIHLRVHCFGEPFVIAALADTEFPPDSGDAELARAAALFTLMYERFRLMESMPLRVTGALGTKRTRRSNAG